MKFHMLMFMNAWMMLVLMKCRFQMQSLTLGCYIRSSRIPHACYADSFMNDGPGFHSDISDKSSPNLSLEPSLYQPPLYFFQCMSIHSSILIHPSIAYAIIASQCFASRHEAVVVSFDMSGDRPGFESHPTKDSRPPCVK